MLLTPDENRIFRELRAGCYCGQPGITLRFGNSFWFEHSGTLGTAGGDNLQTIIRVRKQKAMERENDGSVR